MAVVFRDPVRSFPLHLSGRACWVLWLPVLIASALGICASEPAAPVTSPLRITSAGEFWTVPTALRDIPHELDAELTVTFYDPHWKLLWAADRDGQSYWPLSTTTPQLKAGQRIHLAGSVIPSVGLEFEKTRITLLEDRVATAPLLTADDFDDTNRFNARLVTVDAFVNAQTETDPNHIELDLTVDGVPTRAYLLLDEQSPIPQLSGAFVRLTGVYDANLLPQLNVTIWVARADDIVVTGWLDSDPNFKLPPTSIEQLTETGHSRVRVMGEVQSQKPGEEIVLRDETGQITLKTTMKRIVAPGERIEAVGLPLVRGVEVSLRQAIFRVLSDPAPQPHSQGLPLLRLADQVRQLPADAAQKGYAVRLGGVVTWSHPTERIIYLHDASGGIALTLPPDVGTPPPPGMAIRAVGHTIAGSFAPGVQAESIEASKQVPLLDARSITLEQAMTGVEESQWVTLSGFAREITRDGEWSRLHVSTPGGDFVTVVPHSPRIDTLAGAIIRVSGVCRAETDRDLHLTGIEVWAPSGNEITVEEPAPAEPFLEPLQPITSLSRFNPLAAFNRRARVAGIVLHHEPGAYIHLQEDQQALLVLSRDSLPIRPGDRIEAVGFPGRQGSRIVLREATYRRIGDGAEPDALPLDNPGRLQPGLDGRLVQIETTIADVARQTKGVRLIGQSDGVLLEALLDDPAASVEPGSHVSLRAVYVLQFDQDGLPRTFQLQLRSIDDVIVLSPPSWWTVRRTMGLAGGLALAILLGLAWLVALRRRVTQQTAQIREQLEKSARLEAELVRSSRLESLGVLAGGIAHDFNNLLTVILGNVSLVRSGRNLDAEDDRFLRESERAGLRARDLTQQLLTFSKGGAPVRSAVLLPDIVREAAGFALHGSNVRCDFDFSPKLWPGHVDRGQISQVVHNIVINAMHAMPTGGVVRITLRNEQISENSQSTLAAGRYLQLSIRDNGTGISPQHLAHIFDPYFTTKQQGSGLGLATVYSIIKKHGGTIDVESELGRGTAFHIWLPAAERETSSASAEPAPLPRLRGRALVMDDEAPVREMAASMLRRLGLDVTTTVDGHEVVRAYAEALSAGQRYSLVILDLTVPGAMGGKEAIAELLKLDPDVRAVVSSGYSNDPVMAHYREHGFRARVPKPYEFDQFARTIAGIDSPEKTSALPTAS